MDQVEDELVNALLLVYVSAFLGVLIWILRGKTGRLDLFV